MTKNANFAPHFGCYTESNLKIPSGGPASLRAYGPPLCDGPPPGIFRLDSVTFYTSSPYRPPLDGFTLTARPTTRPWKSLPLLA